MLLLARGLSTSIGNPIPFRLRWGSNSDIAHEVGESYDHFYKTDTESMGEDDFDQETKSENKVDF